MTKYKFQAFTNSTTHPVCEKEFKSELALKIYLTKFLNEYGQEEKSLVEREDDQYCLYDRRYKKLEWRKF